MLDKNLIKILFSWFVVATTKFSSYIPCIQTRMFLKDHAVRKPCKQVFTMQRRITAPIDKIVLLLSGVNLDARAFVRLSYKYSGLA